ncbi:MAG: hypothetical protein JWP27_2756 [Flaviaesturariibacter sp.]|nr:hypothetical protein [Flaviaesturariibacter sp.]
MEIISEQIEIREHLAALEDLYAEYLRDGVDAKVLSSLWADIQRYRHLVLAPAAHGVDQ